MRCGWAPGGAGVRCIGLAARVRTGALVLGANVAAAAGLGSLRGSFAVVGAPLITGADDTITLTLARSEGRVTVSVGTTCPPALARVRPLRMHGRRKIGTRLTVAWRGRRACGAGADAVVLRAAIDRAGNNLIGTLAEDAGTSRLVVARRGTLGECGGPPDAPALPGLCVGAPVGSGAPCACAAVDACWPLVKRCLAR